MNTSKSGISEEKWQYISYMEVKTLSSSKDCAVKLKGLYALWGGKILRQRICMQNAERNKNSWKLIGKGEKPSKKGASVKV